MGIRKHVGVAHVELEVEVEVDIQEEQDVVALNLVKYILDAIDADVSYFYKVML